MVLYALGEAHAWVRIIHNTASVPPPRDLKVSDPTVRDLTLAELGLSPSSILHLRFVDDSLNGTVYYFFEPFELILLFHKNKKKKPGSDSPAPLASAVLEHAIDLPTPPGFDGNQKKKETSSAVSASGPSNTVKGPTGAEVKIPKWLKLGSSAFLPVSSSSLSSL